MVVCCLSINCEQVWYSSYGGIKEIKLDGTKEVMVDTGHLVAFEDTVEYKVDKVGGIKSLFFGGEGLVMKLSGKGKIYIQASRCPTSFLYSSKDAPLILFPPHPVIHASPSSSAAPPS